MRRNVAGLARGGALAAVGFCLGLLLAGCGPTNTVNVNFKGYTILPDPASIKAGNITFQVANKDGQVLHQFVVVQTDLAADKLPLNADGNVDQGTLKVIGAVDKIDVGQSSTLAASLAPGHYVLLCNVPGHYRLGMHTDFTASP